MTDVWCLWGKVGLPYTPMVPVLAILDLEVGVLCCALVTEAQDIGWQ